MPPEQRREGGLVPVRGEALQELVIRQIEILPARG
jgi:hypothetical protein